MRNLLFSLLLGLGLSALVSAAELQGVLTDWNCTERMVKDGRAKVLKQDRSCSLAKQDFHRAAYGLITDDKKFYRIDPQNNDRVIQVLTDSPDKDNLRVVISGDLNGNTLSIRTISLL